MTKEAWDEIGDEGVNPSYDERKNKLIEDFFSRLPKSARVLDLGCGNGLPFAKKMVELGFEVVGVDVSSTMIKNARKNVPQARFIQKSMMDVDFSNEFDGVFSSFSMLLLNPEQFDIVAEKISKSLKHNGLLLLIINEPHPGWQEDDVWIIKMGKKIYSRPYTEEEIKTVFSEYGMKILKVHREVSVSKFYGKEYVLTVLLKKL